MGRRKRSKSKTKKQSKKAKREEMYIGTSPRMEPKAAKVIILRSVFDKIMYFIDKSPVEISGLGQVEIVDGIIYVTDAILLKQTNAATSTDIDGDDVAKAMYLLRDSPGELRFWWHSHVDMNAFWSGTDTDTIAQLAQNGWFVSSVFNKKRESRTAICGTEPFNYFLDQVPTTIMNEHPKDITDVWDAEYTSKVEERKWTSYGPTSKYDDSWRTERQTSFQKDVVDPINGNLVEDDDDLPRSEVEAEKYIIQEVAEMRAMGMSEDEVVRYARELREDYFGFSEASSHEVGHGG